MNTVLGTNIDLFIAYFTGSQNPNVKMCFMFIRALSDELHIAYDVKMKILSCLVCKTGKLSKIYPCQVSGEKVNHRCGSRKTKI